MNRLNKSDFAEMFGVEPTSFAPHTLKLIESLNFRFREIQKDELEHLLLGILKRIDTDTQIVGAPDRKQKWENGWQENLDAFMESGFSVDALVPKFIRPGQVIRLKQSYVFPEDPNFELNYIKVLRSWFAHEYLHGLDNIYEFGCGTGFNLLAMSEFFPNKQYWGSDFVQSSVDLVNEIGKSKEINLSAQIFDMKMPDEAYAIKPCSGIYTFGSVEQLSGQIDAFIEYLLAQNPALCIHVEPAEEFYDQNNLSDFLAFKFQHKRGYTKGLYGKLMSLEEQGLINIMKIKRLFFGSVYMEGYNLFVWQKRGS